MFEAEELIGCGEEAEGQAGGECFFERLLPGPVREPVEDGGVDLIGTVGPGGNLFEPGVEECAADELAESLPGFAEAADDTDVAVGAGVDAPGGGAVVAAADPLFVAELPGGKGVLHDAERSLDDAHLGETVVGIGREEG